MTALLAVASLAVDWGYVQCTKSEMQRTADATARGYIALYDQYGLNTANANGPALYQSNSNQNPIDGNSGIAPTVTVTWGYWNTSNSTFYSGTNGSFPIAIRCTITRKVANSNALNLSFGRWVGKSKADITVQAIAILTQSDYSGTATPPATSDIWLAGMPSNATASINDTMSNAAPYQASGIPVVPGTYLTFSNITGFASNGPFIDSSPPDGDESWVLSHDTGAENGIADLRAPIHAMIGVFLTNDRPDQTAAPTGRDYSDASERNKSVFDDIKAKQPFFIGDGKDGNGSAQRFLVPPGVTRLYLGSMDGYEWNNNWGQYNVTVAVERKIELKQ